MKRLVLFAAMLASVFLHAQNPSSYVNPMIGTAGMGHTFPGACVPFGGVSSVRTLRTFLTT